MYSSAAHAKAPPYTVIYFCLKPLTKHSGIGLGAFAASLGFGGLYFISYVPRVREDIMRNVPIIGPYFVKEVPPEDDPF